MKEVTLLDNYLNQLFYEKDTFIEVQNIEGKVFREYENRITKQFEAQNKKNFIKIHGPREVRERF